LQLKGTVLVNDDEGLEREADSMGAKAMHTTTQSPIQRFMAQNTSQVVQRAIGAEAETNMNMFRDGKPAGFPNGTRLGRIVTTHGQSDVVVDTEFVVEISTAPFNQANADNLSNLGLHLAEVTELLQNTNTPTRGIQLEDAYKDLTFKLDGKLTGDFHINVSPHDIDSFELLYKANAARQSQMDIDEAVDLRRLGFPQDAIPDERLQRGLKETFLGNWRQILDTQLKLKEAASLFTSNAKEVELRTLLTRVISDVAIGLNTRKVRGGQSRKNDLELMPKIDIQMVIDQWAKAHTGDKETKESDPVARKFLMATFASAMEATDKDIAQHLKAIGQADGDAVKDIYRDAKHIIEDRRPIIRDRRKGTDLTDIWGGSTEALIEENPKYRKAHKKPHYLEGVVRPTTSNLIDVGPDAPVGVYEDRRPFVPSQMERKPFIGSIWQEQIANYERDLQRKNVIYMNGQQPLQQEQASGGIGQYLIPAAIVGIGLSILAAKLLARKS
jgi:hypothetical protein